MICWLFGHKKYLAGRHKRYLDAFVEYWHCERCMNYWKKIQPINKWHEKPKERFDI